MKQKFILIFALSVIIVVFLSGCAEKVQCGNNKCEAGENKCSCSADCGQCSGSAGACLEYTCSNNQCATQKISGCCGNQVCEGAENYDSCPTDCITESSVEASMSKIKISESDLPTPVPITYHRDILWYKGVDGASDESYSPLPLQGFKPLAGWQVGIYPAVKEGDLFVDISVGWIRQYVYAFTPEDAAKVISMVDKSSFPPLVTAVEELPNPNIGDSSKAFKASDSLGRIMHLIIFVKKGYYEILTLDGNKFEYKVLEDAARKAAGKINYTHGQK